jgi:transcriptional regulator with XRE-family HTH domain
MEPGQRPNQRLRLQRRLRGWSQEEVAAGLHRLAASLDEPELGVDATMVSRWERGMRRPRPRYVRLLCRLFELSPDQLGIVEDLEHTQAHEVAEDLLEDDAVERRDFIQRVTALLGAAVGPLPLLDPSPTEAWERLATALRQPGLIDDEAVDHLERITVQLQSLGPSHVSSHAIMGPVIGHLDAITSLLQRSLPASLRARLCSLAGETAGFAGWLHWDADDARGAAAYFDTALVAAREADDRALGAYLAGSAACRPPYRETNPQSRIDQLHAIPRSHPTPSSQVWLAAKAADAHALMGDAGGCLRALERAEIALDGVGAEDESRRPRFSVIGRTWLDGERGASLAKLGHTAEARAALEPVVTQLGPASERDRLWLCTSLASTYVQDGEPEQACRVACAALEQASRMQLQPVLKIMRGLCQELRAYGPSPAIEELDVRLRDVAPIAAAS